MSTTLRPPTALPRADRVVYDRAVALEAAARSEAIRARQRADAMADAANQSAWDAEDAETTAARAVEALWKVRCALGVK